MYKQLFAFLSLSLTSLFCFLLYIYWISPRIGNLEQCFTSSMSKLKVCPKSHNYTKLNEFPTHFKNAVLIAEDASFYYHNGFDLYELQMSISKNIKSNTYARGASTISQQLIKNIYLRPEKSILRKLKEAFLTLQLEKKYSKDKILELYLNTVQFGLDTFGANASSKQVFQKNIQDISLAEAITLAQALPNPNIYLKKTGGYFLKKVSKRCLGILEKLYKFKRITHKEYLSAKEDFNLPPWHPDLPKHVHANESLLVPEEQRKKPNKEY